VDDGRQTTVGEWFTSDFWRETWREADGKTRAVVAIALAVSLLLCAGFGVAAVARLRALSTTPTAGANSGLFTLPTDTSAVPTIPAATNTPAPQPLSGATLGGRWSGFENAYGPQAGGQQNTWDATIAGQDVQIFVDLMNGTDGQPHIYVVNIGPLDSASWPTSADAGLAQAFLPPDAAHVQDVAANGGTAHIYRSARLGATLPTSVFTSDSGGQAVPVGTLVWQCSSLAGAAGSGDDACIVTIGTP
jgi:hypothetical protein